jgi:hypothetical protein
MNAKSSKNEELASILANLSHPLRIDILKLVYAEPRSFSDLLTHLSIESSGKLSFHLEKLSRFIKKNELGYYEVTERGVEVYTLLNAFERSELSPPVPLESKILRRKEIKASTLIIGTIGFLAFINAVITIVTRYFGLISLFISIGIFIFVCYKMNLPLDMTKQGTFLLFFSSIILALPFSYFLFPLSVLLSGFTDEFSLFFVMNFDFLLLILLLITLLYLIEYLSDDFGWVWSLPEDNNSIFRGPEWLLDFKNKKIWYICLFLYMGFFVIYGRSGYDLELHTEHFYIYSPSFNSPFGILFSLLTGFIIPGKYLFGPVVFPVIFYLSSNSIIISIIVIYSLYKSNKFSSEINSLISIGVIVIIPIITLILNLMVLSTPTEANNQNMINLFFISQVSSYFFQLMGIIGLTLFVLLFLSKIEQFSTT